MCRGPYGSVVRMPLGFFLFLSIGSVQAIHSAVTLKLESFRCHPVPEILANEKRVFINFRLRQLTQIETQAGAVTLHFQRPNSQFNPNGSEASSCLKSIQGAFQHIEVYLECLF